MLASVRDHCVGELKCVVGSSLRKIENIYSQGTEAGSFDLSNRTGPGVLKARALVESALSVITWTREEGRCAERTIEKKRRIQKKRYIGELAGLEQERIANFVEFQVGPSKREAKLIRSS